MHRDTSNPDLESEPVYTMGRQTMTRRSGLSRGRLRRWLRRMALLLPIIICAYLMLALYLNSVPGFRDQMHQDHPIAGSTVLDVAIPDVIMNMLDILSLPRYLLEQWIAQFQQPDPSDVVGAALATAGPGVATAAAQPAPADTPTPVGTASQPAPAPTSTAQPPSAEPTPTMPAPAGATPTPTIRAATPIASATPSATPTTTEAPTSTPTPTETGTTEPTEIATATASITVEPSWTGTPTPAETTTATASATTIPPPPPPPASSTPTLIATATATDTATATGTATGTATASSTATPTPTPTASSTATSTPTSTATVTSTSTRTPTPTLTPTPTPTPAPIRIEPDYIPCEAGSDQVLQVNGTVRRDWEPQRQFEYTFQAPAQSVIEVLGYAKEGHPERGCPGGTNCGDVQLHEEFTVSVNAEPIGTYRDRGDIHEWVNFGVWKSSPVPPGQQTLVVRHLGDGAGAQSVDFKLTICVRPPGAVQVPTSTSTMTPTTTATP